VKFFCIADKDSALGFRLAGINTLEAASLQEAQAAWKAALAAPDAGVVLVTELAAKFLREEIQARIYKDEFPLVLEIPSSKSQWQSAGAAEFLKRAIGINV